MTLYVYWKINVILVCVYVCMCVCVCVCVCVHVTMALNGFCLAVDTCTFTFARMQLFLACSITYYSKRGTP